MTTDTPRTDAELIREAKIIKSTKQNYHGLAKSKTAWYETMLKTRKIYEEGENTRTDAVPSTQIMLTAQSDPVKLYQQLCKVTVDFGKALDACVEYRNQLAASQAEVDRLRWELLNRALECSKVYGGILGVEAAKQISEELAPAPEEAVTQKGSPNKETPLGTTLRSEEYVLAGNKNLEGEFNTVKEPAPEWRIRAEGERIEPLEKELDYLTKEASRAADIHNHVLIVDCIRYLRDEIEQLKKNQK
jgi:hypothetical protein